MTANATETGTNTPSRINYNLKLSEEVTDAVRFLRSRVGGFNVTKAVSQILLEIAAEERERRGCSNSSGSLLD